MTTLTEAERGMTPDIIEQLEWAEGWFDTTGGKTIPVEREHGLWLFRESLKALTASRAEIERLREALEGDDPEMPQAIQPIGWLHAMIEESKRRGPDEKDDDPSAYWEMVGEVEALYQKAISALTHQGE